ncbi:MAG: creatininase family protein [Gemmatimonadaceae bacterium]
MDGRALSGNPVRCLGANEIGNKRVFPGSYTVRPATLRAVFMDLATELGDQGFRWIFIVHAHGGPGHNLALDQAGDYFRDTYGGRMVHLAEIVADYPVNLDSLASRTAAAEDGFTVHAGLVEHSAVMALRPDLVSPTIRTARSITGKDFPDLIRLSRERDWPGYFGAPRYASAEIGRAILAVENPARIAVALRILDGADERTLPRFAARAAALPAMTVVTDSAAIRDAAIEARQRKWLARRRP